jgi:uncharacterized protein YdhG (YjbR/CyaY superfamily)
MRELTMPGRKPAAPGKADTAKLLRAYFAAQPPVQRRLLKQLRTIIRTVAPDAVDAFSYRIPAARLDGKIFVWYAGFTAHVSLFPMTARIRRAFAAELKGYNTGKGTVQFPVGKRLPVTLIKRLVKARIAEMK